MIPIALNLFAEQSVQTVKETKQVCYSLDAESTILPALAVDPFQIHRFSLLLFFFFLPICSKWVLTVW